MNTRRLGSGRSIVIDTIFSRWIFARRTICYVLLVLLPSEAFMSCAGGRFLGTGRGTKYVYSYTLTYPENSPSMVFQDDSLKIQFNFDASAIRFQLQNLSTSNMMVRWNHVSIGVDNRFSVVRHSVDFYSDSARLSASALVPPTGYILETVIPAENVRFDATQWTERDLFTTTDHGDPAIGRKISENVGKSVVLMLPLQFGNSMADYRFEFQVTAVRPIAWSDYRPPRRNPPGSARTGISVGDEITTAFITVGLLGFVAFMVSLKKNPVSE